MGRNLVSGPIVARWVAQRNKGTFSEDTTTAIGLQRDDGELLAGVVYENWNGRSIVVHLAIRGPVTRGFLGAVSRYAFIKCGVEKAIAPVASTNATCIRFIKHFGFAEECRIRDAVPGGDIILFTLRKPDCRFLGDEFNG